MNCLRTFRLSKWVYNDRPTDKNDRQEFLGSNETYFNKEMIKTHLTVVFKRNYITHFFRQLVA